MKNKQKYEFKFELEINNELQNYVWIGELSKFNLYKRNIEHILPQYIIKNIYVKIIT